MRSHSSAKKTCSEPSASKATHFRAFGHSGPGLGTGEGCFRQPFMVSAELGCDNGSCWRGGAELEAVRVLGIIRGAWESLLLVSPYLVARGESHRPVSQSLFRARCYRLHYKAHRRILLDPGTPQLSSLLERESPVASRYGVTKSARPPILRSRGDSQPAANGEKALTSIFTSCAPHPPCTMAPCRVCPS